MFGKFITGKLNRVIGKGKKAIVAAGLSAGVLAVVACQAPEPTPTPNPSPTVAPTATATPHPTLSTTCSEPVDPGATALLLELQSCRPDISPETKELIRLYVELQSFKDNPEFHQVGFGACCEFSSWKEEVGTLADSAGVTTIREIGISPGDLLSFSLDYFQNAGQPTQLIRDVEADLRAKARETMGLVVSRPMPTADSALGTETIGEWEHVYIGFGKATIVILSVAGQLRMETTFSDGSKLNQSLVEGKSSVGRRFDLDDGSGEYFVINRQGDLQIWDRQGLISTATKSK